MGNNQINNVTIDNCHEEPIHIPGSIQEFGYLIAVDKYSFDIASVSENLFEIIGQPPEDLIGKSLSSFLPQDTVTLIQQNINKPHAINPATVELNSKVYEIVFSVDEHFILLDIEQKQDNSNIKFESHFHQLKSFLNTIIRQDSLEQVFQTVAEEVRELAGFDRVMVYKFDDDYNGEVIAEAKQANLNSFLKQHFPESDIPSQARALYLKNRIRLLGNVDGKRIALIPDNVTVDLSNSSLRSVSPIHCQYLRNMGVSASMSISLTQGERLWGLIACHHYSPKVVPFSVRETCAYLGLTLSHFITVREREKLSQSEAKAQGLLTSILDSIASEVDFKTGLAKSENNLIQLVAADGIAWQLDGEIEFFGKCPAPEQVRNIYKILEEKLPENETYIATDSIDSFMPGCSDDIDAISGVLLLTIDATEKHFFMWFKSEIIQTKNWGGKPEKVIEFQDDGSHRLMPRSSFALWKEKVRHHSLPWTELDKISVLKLRNTIVNYVFRRNQEIKNQNMILRSKVDERTSELQAEINARVVTEAKLTKALADAETSNKELEQFAYVASHDLQEPLRKIQSFGSRLEALSDKFNEPELTLYISRMTAAADRMQSLIKDLLSFSRINTEVKENELIDLDLLIGTVLSDLKLLIGDKKARFEIEVLGSVNGAKSQLYRLFQNLIQNSLKFSKPDINPTVRIAVAESSPTEVTYLVEDNGIGFDMQYASRVFQLFQRLHGRSAYEGTGLGLAICKRIVERHHGHIRVESAEGAGTRFYITLPKIS